MKEYRSQVVHCGNDQGNQKIGNQVRPVVVAQCYHDCNRLILGSTTTFQVIREVGNIPAESFYDEMIDRLGRAMSLQFGKFKSNIQKQHGSVGTVQHP
ncbi:hypothetical protein E6O75_ATG02099 [Venturia nashicola]|uniref:Uncharacterized protein n=1 Tax=Venturia nashicola TaxID=86259 RepID=A0A4Z1P4M4_9PEZI|nr:hypothetical protein E6O75_ATG02099 [Venturia nashicola]